MKQVREKAKTQNQLFCDVIDYIMDKFNCYLSNIAFKIGVTDALLSQMKKNKKVSQAVIKGLEKEYRINPNYLLGKSIYITLDGTEKVRMFENLIYGYNAEKIGNKECLLLRSDSILYNMLIKNKKIQQCINNGYLTKEDLSIIINKMNERESGVKEFVLISKEDFDSILNRK